MELDERPRVNPDKPTTWPACNCGDPSSYLVRIKKPEWANVLGEARIGDYSGHGRTRFSRYFVLCDGCRELARELDAHIALIESIRSREEAAHDE